MPKFSGALIVGTIHKGDKSVLFTKGLPHPISFAPLRALVRAVILGAGICFILLETAWHQ